MILNDNKPPLEDALVHYGVPGMRWGRRKGRDNSSDYDDYDELDRLERRERNKRIAVGAALVAVGTIATVAVLNKTGTVKINPDLIAKGKAAAAAAGSAASASSAAANSAPARAAFQKIKARGDEYDDAYRDAGRKAYGAYKKSDFANRSFRPPDTGNPLWSRTHPNVGFDMGPRASAQRTYDGSFRVHSMDRDVWDMPMLALTSGRK